MRAWLLVASLVVGCGTPHVREQMDAGGLEPCGVPEVLVVVDRSSSLAGKWPNLTDQLSNFFQAEQMRMAFGLRVTPGVHLACGAGPIVPIALNDATDLTNALSFPTVDALSALNAGLVDVAGAFGDHNPGEWVLLVTGGGDGCNSGDAVASVESLLGEGVRTAVIDVSDDGNPFLDTVAAAGGTDRAFAAPDAGSLNAALSSFATLTRRCVCTPGRTGCIGPKKFESCSDDGTSIVYTDCTPDADPCTVDCDPSRGCNALNTSLTCNDGNACTVNDNCSTSTCTGTPKVCNTPPAPACVTSTLLETYADPGMCSATDGACSYTTTQTTCPGGCVSGSPSHCAKWSPTSTTGAPASRRNHVAVWSGKYMVVFGGTGAMLYGDGGRYDPATDTWSSISATNAPSPRAFAAAVWTGTEMIVWGGGDGSVNSVGDGARYNPTTDQWTPMTGTGAPAARYAPYYVWTGTEMIIWGGSTGGPGGRYNPSTDSWAAMTTTSEPTEPRLGSQAVWTGTEMLFWSGLFGGTTYADGGRYSPDQWTAMATLNGPGMVGGHLTEWVGNTLVVAFGNGSGGTYRYSPTTDTWTISQAPPVVLNYPCWVSTGTEVITWGGNGFDVTPLHYNPTTDKWTQGEVSGGVQARYANTAVWTGSEMIVWGGNDTNSVTYNTGWRYKP